MNHTAGSLGQKGGSLTLSVDTEGQERLDEERHEADCGQLSGSSRGRVLENVGCPNGEPGSPMLVVDMYQTNNLYEGKGYYLGF